MEAPRQSHQRRAVEPDGTVHAARYASDRHHFTIACSTRDLTIERVEHTSARTVTCPACQTSLDGTVITCLFCRTPGAMEYREPAHEGAGTLCARCTACQYAWVLDSGAHAGCPVCGGSGHTGRGSWCDPLCTCYEEYRTRTEGDQYDRLSEVTARRAAGHIPFDDVRWLIDELARDRGRLNELRFRINHAGSLMSTSSVAVAINHTRRSGHDPRTPGENRSSNE